MRLEQKTHAWVKTSSEWRYRESPAACAWTASHVKKFQSARRCVATVQPSLFIIRRFGLFGAVQHDMSFKAPHCFRALRPRAVPPSYGVYLWEHDRRRLGGILRERLCRGSPAGKN